MSAGVVLKTFVIVGALGLGATAVALAVGIQRDPWAFTTPQPVRNGSTRALPSALARLSARAPATQATIVEPVAGTARPEVRVIAQVPIRRVTRQVVVLPVAGQPVAPAAPEARETPEDRVLPAPCVEGEYRKLDDRQGVRISCPGKL